MGFIKVLYYVFSAVFFLNALVLINQTFRNKKRKQSNEQSSANQIYGWREKINDILIITSICISVIIVAIVLNYYKNSYLSFICLFPGGLYYIWAFWMYAKTMGGIVFIKDGRELKENEYQSIRESAGIIALFAVSSIPQKILNFIRDLNNPILSDHLVIGFYALSIYILLFYIFCLSLLLQVYFMPWFKVKFEKFDKNRLDKAIYKIRYFLWGDEDSAQYPNTVRYIDKILQHAIFYRFILFPFCIFTVIIDIIWCLLVFLIRVLCLPALYILLFVKEVLRVFRIFTNWLLVISQRMVLAICFRIAAIVGLCSTVIINRYDSFLRCVESSTAILEFLASVIIIPVVIDSISKIRSASAEMTSTEKE